MSHPDQPEKKEPCRMCDGVGGAIEGCPCSRCEGARRHDRHTASDAPKTMGEGPRIDGRDDRVLLAGGIFYSQRRDGILWVDAAEVHNYLKGQDLSSLSQERDEMKEKADELEIVLKGLLLLRVGLSENDIIWVRAQKALAAYAKAGEGAS